VEAFANKTVVGTPHASLEHDNVRPEAGFDVSLVTTKGAQFDVQGLLAGKDWENARIVTVTRPGKPERELTGDNAKWAAATAGVAVAQEVKTKAAQRALTLGFEALQSQKK
jgi:hypothetical protein